MRAVKNIIRKMFAAFGLELRRFSDPSVRFENFANLSSAYEHSLNEREDLIVPDNLRPKLMSRLQGTPPSEAYFIVQGLARCHSLPGDVCEFGVAQGETSAVIANEIARFPDKRLHLFDSFEGLPKPTDKDRLKDDIFSLGNMQAYEGTMFYPEDMVLRRMAAIKFPQERFVIHKGFIEKLIHEDRNLPEKVCFAYVDFDFYEPIKTALEFLHTVTPEGAVIIVDDYGFFSTGVQAAVDEFVHETRNSGTLYECFIPDKTYGCFAVLTRTKKA